MTRAVLGTRRERSQAEQFLQSRGLDKLEAVKAWLRKNPKSPERDKVINSATVALSIRHDLTELQSLTAKQPS